MARISPSSALTGAFDGAFNGAFTEAFDDAFVGAFDGAFTEAFDDAFDGAFQVPLRKRMRTTWTCRWRMPWAIWRRPRRLRMSRRSLPNSSVLYNPIQYCKPLYSTVHPYTVQNSTALCATAVNSCSW